MRAHGRCGISIMTRELTTSSMARTSRCSVLRATVRQPLPGNWQRRCRLIAIHATGVMIRMKVSLVHAVSSAMSRKPGRR